MDLVEFEESNMKFGPFSKNDVFRIEDSKLYARVSEHVKVSDFFLLRPEDEKHNMLIVEAKSSSPKPTNGVDFNKYMNDLVEKFENSLNLFSSAALGRHGEVEDCLPPNFNKVEIAGLQITFVLIVSGHKKEWLAPIRDKLDLQLRRFARSHALRTPYILALNDTMAKSKRLVQ